MAKKENVEILCERELLEKILRIVERQEQQPSQNAATGHCLYDNKALMEKLHIKDQVSEKTARQRLSRLFARGRQVLVYAGRCEQVSASLSL